MLVVDRMLGEFYGGGGSVVSVVVGLCCDN